MKFGLLTDIDMFLMVEHGIRVQISHAIHQYTEINKKTRKIMIKIKYWDVKNLYGLAMSWKLPVDGFKRVENTSALNEDFKENCN